MFVAIGTTDTTTNTRSLLLLAPWILNLPTKIGRWPTVSISDSYDVEIEAHFCVGVSPMYDFSHFLNSGTRQSQVFISIGSLSQC